MINKPYYTVKISKCCWSWYMDRDNQSTVISITVIRRIRWGIIRFSQLEEIDSNSIKYLTVFQDGKNYFDMYGDYSRRFGRDQRNPLRVREGRVEKFTKRIYKTFEIWFQTFYCSWITVREWQMFLCAGQLYWS